jgi:hypothetical protein
MNEKVFIPAQPVTVPVEPIDVPNHPRPNVKGADAQSQTPASATKKVSSKLFPPSNSRPPHINPQSAKAHVTHVVTSKKP